MSQAQYSYAPAPRETNGLGIAGFVCSLVGLLATGGLLCPVGLILSLIAIGRRPRGFAVAGLILGLVGSCGWIIAFFVFGAVLLAMMATALGLAVAVALTEPEKMEITGDMANMAVAIALYEEENKYLPADLETLGLRPTVLRDPWGTPYQYHLTNEDPGFDLVSAGADLQFGTLDDVRLTTLGETWEAGGFNVNVTEDDAGRVKISIGDRTITAGGDDDGGRVTLDLGDRVIEIIGDEDGGSVDVIADPEETTTRPDEAGDESAGDAEGDADGDAEGDAEDD